MKLAALKLAIDGARGIKARKVRAIVDQCRTASAERGIGANTRRKI
jgi:hypothetical protein